MISTIPPLFNMKMRKILGLVIVVFVTCAYMPVFSFAGGTLNDESGIYITIEGIKAESPEQYFEINALSGSKEIAAYDADGNDISREVEWTCDTDNVSVESDGLKKRLKTTLAPVGKTAVVTATDLNGKKAAVDVKLVPLNLDDSLLTVTMVNDYGDPWLETEYDYSSSFPTMLRIMVRTPGYDKIDGTIAGYIREHAVVQSTNEEVLPAQNVLSFDGDDPNQAYWDLCAIGEGKTQITLSIEDEYMSWSYSIDAETLNGMKLSTQNLYMEPGEEALLKAEIQPGSEPQDVTFESDNGDVAAVTESGKIVAKKNGKATITVKQTDGSKFEGKCLVLVVKSGLYLIDEGFDASWDPSKMHYIDTSKGLELTEPTPVLLRYCTKDDIQGHNTDIWQSHDTGIVTATSMLTNDNVKGRITPRGNGQTEIKAISGKGAGGGSGTMIFTEKAKCKVTVNVPSLQPAETGVRKDYSPQGMAGTTLEMEGFNMSTNPSNGFEYENYINSLLDKKSADFKFTVRSSKGDGGVKPEDYVEKWMLNHIALYTKDRSKKIASFKDGGLILKSTETNAKKNPTSVSFSIDQKRLNYDTEYVLNFGQGFKLFNYIEKDVSFYFKTKKFTKATAISLNKPSANIPVNGTLELKASFMPKDADDTELTWSSTDHSVAKVDNSGNVTGVKAGTAIITAVNKNGLSSSCKVTVDPVQVAPAKIKAAAAAYNSAKISWEKVNGAAGYAVYGAASKNGKYGKLTETKAFSYLDKGLKTGKTKYYKVRTYTEVNGVKYYSADSNISAAKPALKPIKKVKAQASYNKATVSYQQIPGASGYMIYKASKKNGAYKKLAVVKGGKNKSFTDKKVKTGKTYYYKVKAYRNVDGRKVYSKISKPAGAKAALAVSKMTLKAKKNGIVVKWTKVKGAHKYQIYRSTKKNGGYILVRQTAKRSFTDQQVSDGKAYFYKLRAYRVVDGKKVYSKYTKIQRVKAK